MTMLSAVRDEVLRRADIASHAERAGFRGGRGRTWHCAFHRDKHPSCSIHKNRIRCWSHCSRSWNAIDLAMAVYGLDYAGALRLLAAEVGVPWPDSYSGHLDIETEKQGQQESEYWRVAILRRVEDLLIERKARLSESEPPHDDDSIQELTTFEQTLQRVHGPDLLHLYRRFRGHDAEDAARDVLTGRADLENAREITEEIILLLERAEVAARRATLP